MTIQIRTGTGTNDWQTITNPQIKTGSGANDWASVNKGQIKTGAGANDWTTFYSRITDSTPPTFSFVSATPTSVTVRVIASSSDNKKVYAYRTSNSGNFQSSPANPTTSTINQTFTFSDLSPGTSYNFSSYTAFYDAEGTFVEFSVTSTLDASTTSYSKTTPTTPTNTGTISSTKLSFSSSSSSNYSTNGVAAYIRFELSVLTQFGYSVVQSLNTSILPLDDTTVSKTVQFTGLTANVPYYCRARTYYGSPVDSYSSYSSYSSATSTYPLHTAQIPFKIADYTTDTNLAILTDINAYNNGDAKIEWESAYRARGAQSWLGITTFLGTTVVTGNSTSYYGQNFTVIESREYRFRARVYYETIDKYGPWSDYTGAVRGKTWTGKTTGWISASSTTSSSNASGYSSSMGSDGNQGSIWFSNPYRDVTTYYTQFKILAYFSRAIYYNLNTYYTSSNHAIDENRPSVTTTVTSLRYGISSIARNTASSPYVRLVLDSASRCILAYADEVTVVSSSNSAFNQRYFVMYSSGATVFLSPRGTTPANVTSSSGGTLFVYKTSGNDVSIFGGTSNYYTKGDNYLTAFDYDYGDDVPLSAAGGSVEYLVASTSKVSSRVTESFSANFTPSLPDGHRNAKLYKFSIRVGPTGSPRISSLVVDGINYTQYGDINNLSAYQTYIVTPDVLNSPPYNIAFNIDSAPYSGDNLHYATVTEVQLQATYETLDD